MPLLPPRLTRKKTANRRCAVHAAPLLAAFIPLLVACTGHPPGSSQPEASRLLTLDPLDAPSPQAELIALSLSTNAGSTRFSLEFLDLSLEHDLQVTLDIDLWPDMDGGRAAEADWDLTLTASPGGQLDFIYAIPGGINIDLPTIEWDEALDVVEITFDRWPQLRRAPFLVMVSTLEPDADTPADELGPVASDATENRRADLLLTFWNSFASTTPAEALRSWDGAHSGPAGERFGLRHLLQAVDDFSTPIALLDVNSPENLTGLEFLGNLEYIQQLQERGLLTLPQTLPGWGFTGGLDEMKLERIISTRRAVTTAFGVRPSAWLSLIQANSSRGALSALSRTGAQGLITNIASSVEAPAASSVNGLRLFPLPRTDTAQSLSHDGGLSLGWRQMLIQAALEGRPGRFSMLGGSLEDTFWGDPVITHELFAWLAARAWIEVHNLEALTRTAFPLKPIRLPDSEPGTATSSEGEYPGLVWAGDNPIGDAALDLWFRIQPDQTCIEAGEALEDDFWVECDTLERTTRDGLKALAGGTVRMLAFASKWAEESACTGMPHAAQVLQIDVDGDELDEAVLTSDRFLAVIDPQGGRLVGLFGCTPGLPPTIIVSPRATSAIGMSDPSAWHFDRGEIGEWTIPLLHGGFVSPRDAGLLFNLSVISAGVVATHPRAEYQLQYVLGETGLEVLLTNASPGSRTFELPLNPSPERLLHPGFLEDLVVERQLNGIELGSRSGIRLVIEVDAPTWKVDSYLDSNAPAMRSEDPNEEASLGHFLPFPFTLMTIDLGQGQRVTVHIRILN